MMAFQTLEELAAQECASTTEFISEYGLKTEGIIELIRAIGLFKKSSRYRNTPDGYELEESDEQAYIVPPGFVVPKSADIITSDCLAELKAAYFALITN